MKKLIKSTLYRWHTTKVIIDRVLATIGTIRFTLAWKLLGKHHKLNMRSTDEYRQGLLDLIADLPSGITMVEIGSYRGESAELFLNSGKINKIFCVDPWQPFYDQTDAASFTDMKKVEQEFDNKFSNDIRVSKEKGTIDDFVSRYTSTPKIDFVYIDGCHTEEATAHDIDITMKNLHPTFAIAGHDYIVQGVIAAVDKTFKCPDKIYKDKSWIKYLTTHKHSSAIA